MSDDQIALGDAPDDPAVSFRRFRGASDYGPLAAVLTGSQRAENIDRIVTAEDFAAAITNFMTNCDPFSDIIIAEVGGEVIGYARCWWDLEPPARYLYKHNGFLLPPWRRQGIGRAMLGWLEDRLRKISEKHPAGSEKHFQVSVSRSQVGTATMLERAGYDPVRIFYQMARPTLDDIPDFPLPVGLEIRPATPDQYRAIWESAVETGRDEWGSGEPAIDAYDEWLSQPYFQPHLWQIAWDIDADTVAGHVLTYINDDENKQFDRRRGYTEGIGVVREWRRRGVARALIAMSLRAQKAVGMAESALVADSASADDAVRLYKSCGFQIVEADTIYRKPFVSRIAG